MRLLTRDGFFAVTLLPDDASYSSLYEHERSMPDNAG